MAGKCYEEWIQCRKDKEGNRDVQQNGSQDDKVVEVRTDETNNPTQQNAVT